MTALPSFISCHVANVDYWKISSFPGISVPLPGVQIVVLIFGGFGEIINLSCSSISSIYRGSSVNGCSYILIDETKKKNLPAGVVLLYVPSPMISDISFRIILLMRVTADLYLSKCSFPEETLCTLFREAIRTIDSIVSKGCSFITDQLFFFLCSMTYENCKYESLLIRFFVCCAMMQDLGGCTKISRRCPGYPQCRLSTTTESALA